MRDCHISTRLFQMCVHETREQSNWAMTHTQIAVCVCYLNLRLVQFLTSIFWCNLNLFLTSRQPDKKFSSFQILRDKRNYKSRKKKVGKEGLKYLLNNS